MSAGHDDFFTRWSRRKQAVRTPRITSPDEVQQVARPSISEAEDAPSDRRPPTVGAEAAEPLTPLPSVDDLTAESDLTAYLREGVPELLKKAALRKMWSLDPAIRDHIGLAENAWDFNRPESIPGFGAIGTTTSVPEFLSRRVAAIVDPEASDSSVRAPERPELPTRRTTTAIESDTPAPQEPAPQEPVGPTIGSGPATGSEAETDEPADPVRATPARRHGGALPRE